MNTHLNRNLVVLESPYAGGIEGNVKYARSAVRDSLMRGEAPIASHLLYTQRGILRDEVPEERNMGIDAGHAWLAYCAKVVVYCDLGISPGMLLGMMRAENLGVPIEKRYIGKHGVA